MEPKDYKTLQIQKHKQQGQINHKIKQKFEFKTKIAYLIALNGKSDGSRNQKKHIRLKKKNKKAKSLR